jgi:hypothetical protein
MALKGKAWDWEVYPVLEKASRGGHEPVPKPLGAMNRRRRLRPCLGLTSHTSPLFLDGRGATGEGHFGEGEVWVACPPVRFSLDEVYEGVL